MALTPVEIAQKKAEIERCKKVAEKPGCQVKDALLQRVAQLEKELRKG